MKKDILYLVCSRERRGFTSGVRHDLAHRYNMQAAEALHTMNRLNEMGKERGCMSYRYVIQKQRTKYVEQMGRIYSGLTADPIIKYSDQFSPPYTAPISY